MKPVTVTFDSNVWRPVVSPTRFPNDPSRLAYETLNSLAKSGTLKGAISETVFNLETIQRKDRSSYFGSYQARVTGEMVSETAEGIHMRVRISPDLDNHPGSSDYHRLHLTDALALGFRLLTCPRPGMTRNPELKKEMFWTLQDGDLGPVLDGLSLPMELIQSLGCGYEYAKAVGNGYRKPDDQVWYEAFRHAPSSKADQKRVADAIAEWSDGDSLATHIAHGLDYFCTRDRAVAAGETSIFSLKNREALTARFGVRFVTPDELVSYLTAS